LWAELHKKERETGDCECEHKMSLSGQPPLVAAARTFVLDVVT